MSLVKKNNLNNLSKEIDFIPLLRKMKKNKLNKEVGFLDIQKSLPLL
jgi:hypothetical protein